MSTRQTRTSILILILVFVILVIAGSCATRKKAISIEEASELRSGIWINEHHKIDKSLVLYPDGRFEYYRDLQQEGLVYYGTSEIYESWRDSEGVLWYRAHYQDNVGREGYYLVKISNSDNTFELLETDHNQMIEEWKIAVVGHAYTIWYRQK